MAWLSRVNFTASDVLSYTDLNNLGNDIRAWGGNVNGGGYTLSNVVLSASSGTMATVIGGTGTTSTLTLRSTSGVGTTGADIIFQTGNNGATEVMRLQNGGNVGIGTSSPAYRLDVRGGDLSISRGTSSAADAAIYFGSNSNNYIYSGNASNIFAVATNGSERMRIDSSGNVGIGTSSTSNQKLIVYKANPGSYTQYADGDALVLAGSGNTGMTIVAPDANNTGIYFNSPSAGAGVGAFITYNYNSSAFTFGINSGATTKKFYFASASVGIGTSSPAYQLELSLDSAAKPTTNTWTIASDARLKTVKGEYAKGLAEICQVRPVCYEYNGKGGFAADGKEQVSILAQELMQVFPECVDTFKGKLEEDGPEIDLYNYNGHAITFALINAIKELKAEIDILKARN